MEDEHHDYKIITNLSAHVGKFDLIKDFDCGLEPMNKFYKTGLSRALKGGNYRGLGTINASNQLVGFCTISYAEVDKTQIQVLTNETNLPRHLYCVRIVMLGVDKNHQRKGISSDMMMVAFEQAANVNSQIPVKGICLDSAPNSVSYYEKLGFEKLDEADENGSTPMFLRITRILDALATIEEEENV